MCSPRRCSTPYSRRPCPRWSCSAPRGGGAAGLVCAQGLPVEPGESRTYGAWSTGSPSARSHRRPGTVRCLTILVGFIALAVFWRLPLAVNAMVTSPVLTVVEAVTLLAAGVALWLELVESPPLLPRIARPLRAAFAAVPMWTIWATAYIMGFSHAVWFTAIGHRPKNGLGVIADQELAAVVLWAVPGICFIPVVYFSLITWLRDTADPDDELRDVPTASGEAKPRPPRPASRLAPSARLNFRERQRVFRNGSRTQTPRVTSLNAQCHLASAPSHLALAMINFLRSRCNMRFHAGLFRTNMRVHLPESPWLSVLA